MATKTAPERNAKPKEAPADRVQRYTDTLLVQLKASEVAQRADKSAQMIADYDNKAVEFKASAQHGKSVLDSMNNEIRRLSGEVRSRTSYQPVACERRYCYASGMFQKVRLDTEEILFERWLTDSELQLEFPFASDGSVEKPNETPDAPEADE